MRGGADCAVCGRSDAGGRVRIAPIAMPGRDAARSRLAPLLSFLDWLAKRVVGLQACPANGLGRGRLYSPSAPSL
ncbi:hypothetical protein LG3211_1097 [Lysobacter gummosus]|nr:hypothetical protein LG3211_1097 [Lysobacter gummosus]